MAAADVLAVSGGDPFHLLAAARRTGFGSAARAALDGGAVYVGLSAGAMVAGPTLEPLRLTSPFAPPPGSTSPACGSAPCSSSPTTTARAGGAQRRGGGRIRGPLRLEPLRDGDVLVDDGGRVELRPGPSSRPGRRG